MRPDDALLARLRSLPIFRGLSKDELEDVVSLSHERMVPAGEPLFREGDEGREMFVILKGTVGLQKEAGEGEAWKVTQLGDGAVFGEMALLTNEPRSLSATAVSEVQMLTLTRNDFERIVADSSPIACKMLRNIATVVSHRLRRMDEELLRWYRYDVQRDRKIAEVIRLKDKLFSDWG
jgi:CRP/FNR family transcriptional regulator, cyclic AMP receptor protein